MTETSNSKGPGKRGRPSQPVKSGADGGCRTNAPAAAVVAGPGTGKTKTLVSRILFLIQEQGVKPSEITAVTFTNQAAREMKERLEEELGTKRITKSMTIGTFHAICMNQLKRWEKGFSLVDELTAEELAEKGIKAVWFQMESKTAASGNIPLQKLPGDEIRNPACRMVPDLSAVFRGTESA